MTARISLPTDMLVLGVRQGGHYTANSSIYTVNFPIAFPSAGFVLFAITDMDHSSNGYYAAMRALTKSSAIVHNSSYENRYLVIGY